MEILSHRYLFQGKDKLLENTVSQLKKALVNFNFFETDIRRLVSGEFYISHDPQTTITIENDARLHTELWRSNPDVKIALNVKELGYEKDLVDFLKVEGVINQVFLFDFDIEFLGAEPVSYIKKIQEMEPALRCAIRVSDHNEPVKRAVEMKTAPIVWLDEFDSLWVTEHDIKILKSAGKTVYCIAPDLHNFSPEETTKRFKDFIAWGADGICTDFAMELKELLNEA